MMQQRHAKPFGYADATTALGDFGPVTVIRIELAGPAAANLERDAHHLVGHVRRDICLRPTRVIALPGRVAVEVVVATTEALDIRAQIDALLAQS